MTVWNLDPAHFNVQFSARHMMVATVRGSFKKVDGRIEFDPDNPTSAHVEATIDANSIDTGVTDRDNHLRSPDFLEVEKYPHITFKSARVEVNGDNRGKITGDLTIHGVTRPVTLDVEYFGPITNPWGNQSLGFSASTKINREDFDLTWNMALEAGGWLVGKEIKIEIDGEAIKAS